MSHPLLVTEIKITFICEFMPLEAASFPYRESSLMRIVFRAICHAKLMYTTLFFQCFYNE